MKTNVIEFAQKHASGILSIVASIGVAVTAVLTHRSTVKAQNDESLNELKGFEKIKAGAKYYIFPAVSGAVTIGCIVASHHIIRTMTREVGR